MLNLIAHIFGMQEQGLVKKLKLNISHSTSILNCIQLVSGYPLKFENKI